MELTFIHPKSKICSCLEKYDLDGGGQHVDKIADKWCFGSMIFFQYGQIALLLTENSCEALSGFIVRNPKRVCKYFMAASLTTF
jgi:hypothetical protein